MLKKLIKITLVVIAAAFIIAQFIRPDFTNPPVVPAETLAASTDVPADIQQVLARSCNDCHTHSTQYPWYSQVSPFSWFLAMHIEDGRRELNFSVWNTYTTDKKLRKLEEICEQVGLAYMPLPSYLWIHRDAALSESESKLLCEWAKAEGSRISRGTPSD